MIRISPEMFATTHKTRKKTQRDPNKPIKIRSERQNRSVKNSKRQLLKYIRDHQAQNYKQFSEQSHANANKPSISIKPATNDDSAEFDSDFHSSLKYLESVAEKNQQSNISKLRHNTTLRHAPSKESLLFGSTLGNIAPYDAVDVNIPDVFSEISPTTTETVQVHPRSSASVVPKYGCLKKRCVTDISYVEKSDNENNHSFSNSSIYSTSGHQPKHANDDVESHYSICQYKQYFGDWWKSTKRNR